MFKFHQFLEKYIQQIVCQIGELSQFISGTCKKLQSVCRKATLALTYQWINNTQNQTPVVSLAFRYGMSQHKCVQPPD